MMPEAAPLDVAGMRWATALSKTEKLQAPDPMAVRTPKVRMRPNWLETKGVSAEPKTKISKPDSKTGRGPNLSANAPAMG